MKVTKTRCVPLFFMTGVTNKGHDRCWKWEKQIEALFTTSDSVGALSEMCVLQFK